jgi:protein N-lysine methyltransferase METTL21A
LYGNCLISSSLAIAKAFESQKTEESSTPPILITDLRQLMPLQIQNISINSLSQVAIISAELPWGLPLPETILDGYRRPDVILAADCVYFEPAFPLLLETLGELLGATPLTNNSNDISEENLNRSSKQKNYPVCYFCMKKRRKADMRFINALKKKFLVEQIDARKEIQEEGGGIFLYKVWRKT